MSGEESQPSAPPHRPTFVAYVDESGDEGFSFDKGSSEWFVLSAVVTRKANDLDAVKLVDDVRTALGRPPRKPLHFRDLRHEHRLPFVDRIAKAPLRAVSVLIQKTALREPEKFRERYRLYFYAVRYLLERVSWYCRDHRTTRDGGDGQCQVLLSNRSGMSYDELRKYLSHLKENTGPFDVRIDWSVVDADLVEAHGSGRLMGLQIADAVASSFFYAVERTRLGFTEDRYARMLRPVVYHHGNRYSGYGLKFWPRETAAALAGDDRFRWLADYEK